VAVSSLLLLKLTLAPALVGGAGLAGRRFGPRVGGWLIGLGSQMAVLAKVAYVRK
jgi:hypothetical protein